MHQVVIESRWDDDTAKVGRWAYDQPGSAQDSYSALVKRWRKAGKAFDADDATRTITRHYEAGHADGCPGYTDVIRHEEL